MSRREPVEIIEVRNPQDNTITFTIKATVDEFDPNVYAAAKAFMDRVKRAIVEELYT